MRLSVIIPTVGRPTLKRVLAALPESAEIIVIYDNRTPSRTLQGEFPLVTFLQNTGLTGAGPTRNMGLEIATGDIISFLGDDTIPNEDWAEKTMLWHQQNPAPELAVVGFVDWTDELNADPFHVWLRDKAQFDYANMADGAEVDWRHFYTSNVSLKRSMIGTARFDISFSGWGFEDGEFAYRLTKKGLILVHSAALTVEHDHPQTLPEFVKQMASARINALQMEEMHPSVKIIPRGMKKWGLERLVQLRANAKPNTPEYWWKEVKQAWLGMNSAE